MTPEKIRRELYKRRKQVTMTKIAGSLRCSPQAVGAVIDRRPVSRRIMTAAANAIGETKENVRPEYFMRDADRLPLRKTG